MNVRTLFIFTALLTGLSTELPESRADFSQDGFTFSMVKVPKEDFPEAEFQVVTQEEIRGVLNDAVVSGEDRYIEVAGDFWIIIVNDAGNQV
jgi:hypothetical protein